MHDETLPPADDPHPTSAAQPIAAGERIAVIDVLRGFTIFGILLVNMPLYAWPNWGPMRGIRAGLAHGPLDEAAGWFLWLFAEDKFYPLLSVLFGVGFSVQLMRAPAVHFASLYRRRLAALLLIGLVHGFFLWSGDILSTYALMGFFLLAFRTAGERTILGLAIAFLFLPMAAWSLQVSLHERLFSQLVGAGVDYQELWDDALRVFAHGTYREMIVERARALAWNFSWPISMLQILGLFLLGLYAGRRQFFHHLSRHLAFLRQARWWALAFAVLGMLVRAGVLSLPKGLGPYFGDLSAEVLETAGNLALSFFYAVSIILLAERPHWKRRLAPLAAVGRTALSNYLLQSVVCTTLLYSYGFRLFGKVGPAAGLALTIAIYSLQVPLSMWWLRRFRFGPMEWVWRSLTYGSLQPMRLADR